MKFTVRVDLVFWKIVVGKHDQVKKEIFIKETDNILMNSV